MEFTSDGSAVQRGPSAATDSAFSSIHQPAALWPTLQASSDAAGSVAPPEALTTIDVKHEGNATVGTEAGGGCCSSRTMGDDRSEANGERVQAGSTGLVIGGGTAALGKEGRNCVICGDCAVGCNFNAITCGSCKAFFRRNATKGKMLKCMFSGSCVMNINTRRFCTACRLRKCFAVGMKPDLILDDEEKRLRKEKVLINREKKLHRLQQMQRATGKGAPPPGSYVAAPTCCSSSGAEENDHDCDDDDIDIEPTTLSSCSASSAAATAIDGDITMGVAPVARASDFSGSFGGGAASDGILKEVPRAAASAATAISLQKAAVGALLPPSASVAVEQFAKGDCNITASQPAGCQHCRCRCVKSSNGADAAATTGAANDPGALASGKQGYTGDATTAAASAPLSENASCLPAAGQSSLVSLVTCSLLSDSDLQLLYADSCFSMPTVYPPSAQRRLTAGEFQEIAELERNYTTTFGEVTSGQWDDIKPTSTFECLVNSTTAGMRRMVSFAKCLRSFSSLPQDVQVALLKSGSVACLTIRSAQSYDPDRRCWDDGRGRVVALDLIDQVLSKIDPSIGRRHGALMASVKRLVPVRPRQDVGGGGQQCDMAVFALLLAVTLLSPEHAATHSPSASHSAVSAAGGCRVGDALASLSDAQQRYVLLLGRHLEATYSYALAADLLPSLLQHLAMCKRYGTHMRRWLGTRNVANIDPLLKEMYSIEPPSPPPLASSMQQPPSSS